MFLRRNTLGYTENKIISVNINNFETQNGIREVPSNQTRGPKSKSKSKKALRSMNNEITKSRTSDQTYRQGQ